MTGGGGNGRSGPVDRTDIRNAMLGALREHGELDMNQLSMAAIQARPVVPETVVGNVGDFVEVVDELVSEGLIEEVPTPEAEPNRYRLAG